MKEKQQFAPSSYLGKKKYIQATTTRRNVTGFLVVLLVFPLCMTLIGYGNYFSVSLAEAAKRNAQDFTPVANYRIDEKPDSRELTSEDDVSFIEDEEYYEEEYDFIGENGCNVLGLTIAGEIGTTYGETRSNYFRDTLDYHAGDDRIKAILVDVDSGGGSAVAGDEIATLLEEQSVPVIAQVREMAASAGYMAILSADRIFAHRWGYIGSIGVIMPVYDYSESNKKEGIKYDPILTGPYKDMGSPDRALTKEEREIFQDQINYVYQGFMSDVAKKRNIPLDKVKSLADGKSILAHEALRAGLIDELGGRQEIMTYLRNEIGSEPVICWEEDSYSSY